MYEPTKCCKIVVACAILHNICVSNNLPLEEDDNHGNGDEDDENQDHVGADGHHMPRQAHIDGLIVRRRIIAQRFQ